ncbi:MULTISPECIES: DUF4242 domain-containing protein [unclassified Sphingopyxis]|uniref:DUF4242 domain-containing protein n=1 Tax=unclassified Sphingopyxis TaxID=2614943 RepID=UPI000731AB4F|nr:MULTISPECIES: DUF4242 domain-containing protein [unclassified Sphingopyxis]KTE26677.1 hypothetical protein ATE61_06405 [Sphingopyxis sp. H057]KTE53083.1 hypothetical protein ATE64_08850 [Sphingopyxis sp. H073]KTE54967.1 hypothetical protein ATE69_08830 [Sphingopyxis sp. H071]KTE62428.1 hypothetical protein ATE66_02765 [Sphingopyxis sp. H107]KTE66097.1 hypothetical protein ATE65_07340 [Sphingopyxis sp. H100]
MPRYLVERSFPAGLNIPTDCDGASACVGVVNNNAARGVTWIHSYVSADKRKTYCIYDAPDAEAIDETAAANMLPVDAVSEVRVLDPYFYY